MGIIFRKKIKLGKGLSLNLSKSGISASTGVKGLRFTKRIVGGGPNRLHMGRHGLYYRKDFSNKKRKEGKPKTKALDYKASSNLGNEFNLIDEARRLMKYHKYKEAEKKILEALKISNHGFVFCTLGDLYYKLEKYDNAIKAYKAAIKSEPDLEYYPYPEKAIQKINRKLKKKN